MSQIAGIYCYDGSVRLSRRKGIYIVKDFLFIYLLTAKKISNCTVVLGWESRFCFTPLTAEKSWEALKENIFINCKRDEDINIFLKGKVGFNY